jgi:uncharacterized protein with ParB-like and HNH nuclease domain
MSYESRTIRDAIDEINRTYFLPAIQREFVWDTYRVEKLFDSIMGDYPISSFLFWKVKEENKKDWISYEFIRVFDKENPHNTEADLSGVNKDIYFVLDGQQRLTALNIGFKGSYRYFYYRWRKTELYLNLLKPLGRNDENPEELEYQFQFRELQQAYDPETELWYKVGRVLDFMDGEYAKTDIKNEISHLDDKKQEIAKMLVGRLHSRIHINKIINYHEEKSQDYDKVVEVFIRANTGGKTLEYSDILLSTATAKWKSLNARDEIYNFTDDINTIGLGYSFGKDFILKGSLYLTDGLPIQYKVGNFTKSNLERIEGNWPIIKSGIENTIKLVSKFGFNDKNITAAMALLPIAYYLIKLNKNNYINSSDRDDVMNQSVIQKWLILVLLKNVFGGSSDTTLNNLRTELASIIDYSTFPYDLLNKKLVIGSTFSDEEIDNLLQSNYKTKYSYLILSIMYPDRDWKDNNYHEDHLFPKSEFTSAKLRARGFDDQKISEYQQIFNTILNLQLLTDSENLEKSAKDFDSWISTRDDNFKSRHCIPVLSSYQFSNFIDFIRERKKIIQGKLKSI